MEQNGKFWFVWNPAGCNPKYMHESRASADAEARRLAEDNPGQQFIVLKSVGGFEVPMRSAEPIDMKNFTYDQIPF